MAKKGFDYDEKVAEKICERLANRAILKDVCAEPGMPKKTTVYKWLRDVPSFAEMYARAKQQCADLLAQEIIDIADDGRNDWMESNDPNNPGYRANGEHIQRSRLRVDTRKWVASKLMPKVYGDRIIHDGNLTHRLTDLTEDELDRRLRELENLAQQAEED